MAMWAHEHVRAVHDPDSGLRAIIAVHSTQLGPALGGLRLRSYASSVDALNDALRLSEAMTFKAAAAGLDLGGGKSVVIDDGAHATRSTRLERFAQELNDLDGRYITAEDIGTVTDDMDLLARSTPHVVGRSRAVGGGGDPSPSTARTVLGAVVHGVRVAMGRSDLNGVRVGVIGLGKVGYRLVGLLQQAGAQLLVADVQEGLVDRASDEFGAEPSTTAEILGGAVDVVSPCAIGGLIGDDIARAMTARVVAGGANNMLAQASTVDVLDRRGILYVPDYLANSGGLIHCSDELEGFDDTRVDHKVVAAVDRLGDVLDEATSRGVTPTRVAEERVTRRLAGRSSAEAA